MPIKLDRLERVNQALKRVIGEAIEKFALLPAGAFVSVLDVTTSSDLRNANVSVSIFAPDKEKKNAAFTALLDARGEIQSFINKHLAFKYTPRLHFRSDDRIAEGDRVLALLNSLEAEESGKNESES
ncbi:MAG: 30S ribosome-binding factor RbfA [Victivallaceae bacterium]|nr:30S ribosome-binding factor RbfA [Victivallaceae bacterium]